MCGRFLLTAPVDALAALFGFAARPNLAPRWNIAPTQDAMTIGPGENGPRSLAFARWGLVPAWSRDPASGPPLINARSETVREKPSFRDAFRNGRRLIPADGFYEWSGKGKDKQAWLARPPGTVAFAGLSARWRGPDGRVIDSMAILTAEAGGPLADIHHRTPVVVAPADFDLWLAGDADAAATLTRPPPEDLFTLHPVDNRVGDVRQDDAGLAAPIDPRPPENEPGAGQMSLF